MSDVWKDGVREREERYLSKAYEALRTEVYDKATLYIQQRRIAANEATRLEIAALIAASMADGLYALDAVAARYGNRIERLRKVAKDLRRAATTARRTGAKATLDRNFRKVHT